MRLNEQPCSQARASGIDLLISVRKLDSFFSVKYNPEREQNLFAKLFPLATRIVDTNDKPIIVAENYVYAGGSVGVKIKVSASGFQIIFFKVVCKNI